MIDQQNLETRTDAALFQAAICVARDQWHMSKLEVAERAGMNPRMLHRLVAGKTRATVDQRERILKACNLPVTGSCLLAANERMDLIGTPAGDWLDRFVVAVVGGLGRIRDENGSEIDARWAASDAALVYSRWQAILDRRRDSYSDLQSSNWQDSKTYRA